MTFSLNVVGHAPNEEVERKLFEVMHDIFSDTALSVQSSHFTGLWNSGPVHLPAAVENVQGDGSMDEQLTTPEPDAPVKLADGAGPVDPDNEPPAAAAGEPADAVDETNVAA